jgi:hypothetical protein
MSLGKKVLGVIAVVVLVAAYAAWPRKADLRAFDPAEMARLETAMWRDYYAKRYGALFHHLYESTRTQFGFSPLKSLHLAVSAAGAAKDFSADGLAAGGQCSLAVACGLLPGSGVGGAC